MFLRKTQRKNTDGSIVEYYQLAHNVRDEKTGHAIARIIHNFGRADELDTEELRRLVRSIARVTDQEVKEPGTDGAPAVKDPFPPGVEVVTTRPFGMANVAQALWDRIGIGSALRKMALDDGLSERYERALFTMVVNRLVEPLSKHGTWDRWLKRVHLPECWDLDLDTMYRSMDLLQAHAEKMEEAVFFSVASLYNLEVDVVFFDTTTCSFSIDQSDDEEDGALRVFGHAKEGTWSPQVVVALAVTREGIPVRSWVLPGNTADVTTVERVRTDLRGWKLGRVLFVADSGMNSEENRQELARACGKYILAVRVGSVAEVKQAVLSRPGRYKRIAENLQVKEVVVGDGEMRRRYVVCYNPDQAKKESTHRADAVKELEERLAEHPDKDAKAQWAAELRASKRFGKWLVIDEKGRLAVDRAAVREATRLDGKWVLVTNDDTLSPEAIAASYKALLVIERCFRTLKRTGLKLSPMYHWLPRRIEAHVKICVLSLTIERLIEHQTKMTWTRVSEILAGVQVTEYRTPTNVLFRRNGLSSEAKALYEKLHIEPPNTIIGIQPLK
jgi:transposase